MYTLTTFSPVSQDFLEEEQVVDAEDEAEIVGTQSPKRPSHPSQTSHTSNPSHQHSRTWPTPAGREDEEEEEEEDPNEEEDGAVNSMIHRRKRRQFQHRNRQMGRVLNRDWGRDHTPRDIRQNTMKDPEKDPPRTFQPDSMVRSRSLSWIHTGPGDRDPIKKGGEKETGGETPHKLSKSSLLFPQKSPLSALAYRAKQILSNSAHNNRPHINSNKPAGNKKERREENKIYITRPRPAKERGNEREKRKEKKEEKASRHPREVFPGVFLYQTGKTTRLVNLGAKVRGGGGVTGSRRVISASQLWPKTLTKEDKALPHNESTNTWRETAQKPFSKAAVANQTEKSKRKGEPGNFSTTVMDDTPNKELLIPSSNRQDPPPPPATTQRFNTTGDTFHGPLQVTSYLRTSEITESQQQPGPNPNPADTDQETNQSNPDTDPEPEPEEGEVSDYSYEEVEIRPGWAEESINWQRTFSVNPMDFELLRSDWNDLRCNVSGNLQLAESEVVDVLAQYMEKLNERNGG